MLRRLFGLWLVSIAPPVPLEPKAIRDFPSSDLVNRSAATAQVGTHLLFATNAFLLLFWLLTFCTLWVLHELALQLLQLARARGRNLRNVIIVGEEAEITDLASRMRQETSLGYRVLRTIDAEKLMKNDQIAIDR